MVRRRTDSPTAAERTLSPVPFCWACGQPTWVAYHGKRRITHLWGICCYTLVVRRCRNRGCPQYQWSIRPEEEGAIALPNGKFGLDVIALVGQLWSVEHVGARGNLEPCGCGGIDLAPRTVAGLVRRYISLAAVPPAESPGGTSLPNGQERLVLAIDRGADRSGIVNSLGTEGHTLRYGLAHTQRVGNAGGRPGCAGERGGGSCFLTDYGDYLGRSRDRQGGLFRPSMGRDPRGE